MGADPQAEPAAVGGGFAPRLVALVANRRVVAFELTQPNAGD